MSKIPEHKLSERLKGGHAVLRRVPGDGTVPAVNYAHRDDYYIFVFLEEGEAVFSIDFQEYMVSSPAVLCVLPGQVHLPVDFTKIAGWMLFLDPMFVDDEYKEVFERASFVKGKVEPDGELAEDLRNCASILYRRLNSASKSGQGVSNYLISSFVGMVAEAYGKEIYVSTSKRYAVMTCRFKSLLSEKYKSLKNPSQYAAELNISPVYLNEAVKNTTGMTVTGCIRQEIVTQAKRLLYYTNMSVKEISLELGYEDWAYFIRLFTKATSLSPMQFRNKFLK